MKCPNCGAENPEAKKFCGDCGKEIPVLRTEHGETKQLRLNISCIVGASIGLLSLFATWLLYYSPTEATPTAQHLQLYDLFGDRFGAVVSESISSTGFMIAGTLCLIGTVIAFVTPLGGLLQTTGAAGFVVVTSTYSDLKPGIGVFIALIAGVVVIASLAYPIGLGYWSRKVGAKGRLLTISTYQ